MISKDLAQFVKVRGGSHMGKYWSGRRRKGEREGFTFSSQGEQWGAQKNIFRVKNFPNEKKYTHLCQQSIICSMYSTLAFTSCTSPPSPPTIWSEPRSTDAAWKSGVNRSGVRYRSRINQSNYPDLYVYNEFFNPSLSKLSFICSFNQYFKARRKCSSVKILIVKMWIITAKWNLILNGVQFFYCIVTIKMSWYFYFSIFQAEENRV